ncbi:MAG: hypothetical protein ACRC35_03435 [Angustibacter sp.]
MARSIARSPLPLGSLTQRESQAGTVCAGCLSERTTELVMKLTDGTEVDFISCRTCGRRQWSHDGVELTVAEVLERTRK